MKHAKSLIEDLQVRRPALGRGLRELLLRAQMSTAVVQRPKRGQGLPERPAERKTGLVSRET